MWDGCRLTLHTSTYGNAAPSRDSQDQQIGGGRRSAAHARCDASNRLLHPARRPVAHSLALLLKSAGVADEVVCDYLHIEPEGLDVLLRIAQQKLNTELRKQ
jgi:hypothetical protein